MPAADYQVLAFSDAAPLRSVGLYSSNPLTLDIRGSTFAGVSTVLVNGVPSPEFVVVSSSRILAQVPRTEQSAALRTVKVLLARSGLTGTTSIGLSAIVPGARATGFTKLMGAFLRLMFTNPGEDLANPWAGGGLHRLVGSAGSPGELRATASQSVSDTEQHLIRLQTRNSALVDAERLRSATLIQADYDQPTTALNLRLRLTAMDGTTGNPLINV